MTQHVDKTFSAEHVAIDDNEYLRCQFIDCTWEYAGGKFSLVNCGMRGTFSLSLQGSAANALRLMQLIASDAGGRDYIIRMLDPQNTDGNTSST